MEHENEKILNEMENVDAMYSVTDVAKGYNYWYHLLFEKTLNIFEYENLPENLPAHEIERRIIRFGYSVIFKQNRAPKGVDYGMVTSNGGLSDQDIYFLPKTFTFAQPELGSGVRRIGKNCEIIWNSAVDMRVRRGLNEMIKRYARLLADTESTLATSMILSRVPALTVVKNQSTAMSVDHMFNEVEKGNFKSVNDMGLLDNFDTKDFATNVYSNIETLTSTREKILTAFFSEIGVMSNTTKKERMITEEVNTGLQPLAINISEMLNQRKEGINRVNKLFGTDIKVRINPIYDALNFQKNEKDGDSNEN